MVHRLGWLKRDMLKVTEEHGVAPQGAIQCRCGEIFDDRRKYFEHMGDLIVQVIADDFDIVEFDQKWQTVLGCNQEECIQQGIHMDLHQHRMQGMRLELREKNARPVPEDFHPDPRDMTKQAIIEELRRRADELEESNGHAEK